MKQTITSNSTFEEHIGYSRAVVVNNMIFVSGTTGFDYSTMTIPVSIEEQTEQCFKNINDALFKAGADLSHVVKVTYIIPNADEFSRIWPILKKYFGTIKPTATMISAGLADPRMKIEIEVLAIKL